MTATDFVKWLEGFLEGAQSSTRDMATIEDKLREVEMGEDSIELPQFPFGVVDRVERNDGKVPFHTVCGCEVCGCTMANDMVYPNSFGQINTTNTNDKNI